MSVQWMTETTFQLPWLSKFLGAKLHAENAAKWVEVFYASPEGQQSLTERNLILTPQLQEEDTVRDLEPLVDALRVPIAQLTMLGYNVTHAVFAMAPHVPHYITVIDFARYTSHDFHTPYPFSWSQNEDPSIWEQVVGYSWWLNDPMLPWGAGAVVALLMQERSNLHRPENMSTHSYAFDLLSKSDPSRKVTFRQTTPTHPSATQVFLWDMAVPSEFNKALEALKPRIESLVDILGDSSLTTFRSRGDELTQRGMWWIVQPDLEDDSPRPKLHDSPTAWSCRYALTKEERALLGYCRLNASAVRHADLQALETLTHWFQRGGLDVLSLQVLRMDLAGHFPEYSDADVMRFIIDYHSHLAPLSECLKRVYQYRYGLAPDPPTSAGYENLLWVELLMLMHNLGLIDVIGATRVIEPPAPHEYTTVDLTGFYENDAEDVFSPTMMVRHAGQYLEGYFALRFGDTSGLTRFAIYKFTSGNAQEGAALGMAARLSCELSTDSDATSTGLDSSFDTNCTVKFEAVDDAIIIVLTVPGMNETYELAKCSLTTFLDEEELAERFTSSLDFEAARVLHLVTPNYWEHTDTKRAADWLVRFIYHAFIGVLYEPPDESGSSPAIDEALTSWNEARQAMSHFVTFAGDGVTMTGQSMQFPWFQLMVRRTLQATLLAVGTTPVSAWYKLIDKIRLPTLIYDPIRPIFEHLDELLGITNADLEAFPSDTPNHYEWTIHGLSLTRGFGKLFEKSWAKNPKWLTRGYGFGYYPIGINEIDPTDAAEGLWPAYYYGVSFGLDARFEFNAPLRKDPPTWTLKYSHPSTRHLYTHYHWTPNEFFNITTFELPVELRVLVVEFAIPKKGAALFFGHTKEIGLSFYSSAVSRAETTIQRVGLRTRIKAESILLFPSFNLNALWLSLDGATPRLPSFFAQLDADNSFQLTVPFDEGETELSLTAKQTVREFVARHRYAFKTISMTMEIKGYGADSEPVTIGAGRAQAVYDFLYTVLGDYLTVLTQNTVLSLGDTTAADAVERTVTVRLANSIGPAQPEAN